MSEHIENNMTVEENVEHVEEQVETMGEQAQHALENMGEAVLEQYGNAVEAIEEAHIPEKIEEVKEVVAEKLEEAKEAVQHVMEEYHVQEKIEEAKEAVEHVMEEYHVQEKIEQVSDVVAEKIVAATDFVEDKLEQAIDKIVEVTEQVEEKKPVDEIKERAESELKSSVRPRSNSKLSSMIGMFEKKVEDINSTLTPGVNRPPVARKNSFGSGVRRPSVGEDDRVQDTTPKPSPRGEEGRPRSNSGSLNTKLAMFENKASEPTEGRSRSNSGVKDESPRPRSNSGKLSNMVGMFEKKVEELNSTLTPGVNDLAPKPPKAEVTHVRKNSFGKKQEDEGTEPAPKKSFKWDVKVSTMTSEKKNTDLLKSAVKEESWEKPAKDETETRPRKNSLADRMKQFETQTAEEVQA